MKQTFLTRIANISHIVAFATSTIVDAIILSHVHSSWRETFAHFAETVWRHLSSDLHRQASSLMRLLIGKSSGRRPPNFIVPFLRLFEEDGLIWVVDALRQQGQLDLGTFSASNLTIMIRTPASIAASNGANRMLMHLVENCALSLSATDRDGRTRPLTAAVIANQVGTVAFLLQRFRENECLSLAGIAHQRTQLAHVRFGRQSDNETWTDVHEPPPLHYAAGNGNLAIVKLLIDAGANPNEVCEAPNITPICSAIDGINTDSVDELRQTSKQRSEVIRYLLQYCARVSAFSTHGNATLLCRACIALNVDAVEALLSFTRGVDINEADSHGYAPLHIVCRSKKGLASVFEASKQHYQMSEQDARELASYDAAQHHLRVSGSSNSSRSRHDEEEQRRIAAAAASAMSAARETNLEAQRRREAELAAASCPTTKIVKLLLAQTLHLQIDLQDKTASGKTALMHAVQHANVEVVRLLLEAGASMRIRSKQGLTASQFAGAAQLNVLYEYAAKHDVK